MSLAHSTANGSWYTKNGGAVTPRRPAGIFGNFFGVISVLFAFEVFHNDFDAVSAEKGLFLIEAILRLETCWSLGDMINR
jgi:hypothetical protein